MKYAINISDFLQLSRTDPILHMVIRPHVSRQVITAEYGKVVGIGSAVLLTCPEEQAQALVGVARVKYPKYQLRFYESKTGDGGWKRV